jgi:hypothetical protein
LAATCIRHRVRYCIGGWPTSSENRLATAERDDAASRASSGRVQGWPGRP